MLPQFYCVLTDRDHLKVQAKSALADPPLERHPIWRYIEGQARWLTSLVYLKNLQRPPGRLFLDCGAWSYREKGISPWAPAQCLDQYAAVARPGDLVCAPDSMVLAKHSEDEEHERNQLTLDYAREFITRCGIDLVPVAVNHGHTVATRIHMTEQFLEMGYRAVAIGSVAMRARQPQFITAVLEGMSGLRRQQPFHLHVLGVSALSWYRTFAAYEVDSFDGSTMFFDAFKAARYYWHLGDGSIQEFDARTGSMDQLPKCSCTVCVLLDAQGVDTRRMGSNEHNMGRAVHNINQYLTALRVVETKTVSTESPVVPHQLRFA